jgi:hypothetical protein
VAGRCFSLGSRVYSTNKIDPNDVTIIAFFFSKKKTNVKINGLRRQVQHNGQKKKDKERQHNGQKKKDKTRQHNGQKKKTKRQTRI